MTALPSLRQLNYLVVLSEQRNFTRAAAHCFVTQSTLSAGLRELENTLGTQLVERDRKSVRITPLGHEVVSRARAILSATQDLADSVSAKAVPMARPLRLGIIPTIAPFLLPALMKQLRTCYPALQLTLREDLTSALLSRLEDGQLDLALIALPYPCERFLVAELTEDPLWVVGKANEPQLKKQRVTLTPELSGRLLLLEEGHCLREHTLQVCGKTARKEQIEATSLLTLIQMVESGFGLALIPQIAIQHGLAASPGLTARPLDTSLARRTLALVARRSTSRRIEFRTLAKLIQEDSGIHAEKECSEILP